MCLVRVSLFPTARNGRLPVSVRFDSLARIPSGSVNPSSEDVLGGKQTHLGEDINCCVFGLMSRRSFSHRWMDVFTRLYKAYGTVRIMGQKLTSAPYFTVSRWSALFTSCRSPCNRPLGSTEIYSLASTPGFLCLLYPKLFAKGLMSCNVLLLRFGKKLGLLHPGSSSSETGLSRSSIAFAQSFDFAQNHINWRFAVRIGWSRIEAFFPSVGKLMQDACKTLDDYVYSLIDERNQKSSEATSEKHVDLLGLFMKTVDVDGGRLSRVELKDAAINMMIAGR